MSLRAGVVRNNTGTPSYRHFCMLICRMLCLEAWGKSNGNISLLQKTLRFLALVMSPKNNDYAKMAKQTPKHPKSSNPNKTSNHVCFLDVESVVKRVPVGAR